tara:strand:+ start:317 stop:862 length:546 start_codon:yes stop_codon:yes gene_type:complete
MMNEFRILILLLCLALWLDSCLLNLNGNLVLADQWIVIIFGLLISSVLFIIFRAYSLSLFILKNHDAMGFGVNYVLGPFVILVLPVVLSLIGDNRLIEHEVGREYSYWSRLVFFLLAYFLLVDRKNTLQDYVFNIRSIDEMLRRDMFMVKFPPDKRSDLFGYDVTILVLSLVSFYLLVSVI